MDIPAPQGATPAMAQWFAVKAAHPDALAFFRMGDFYELFFADAEAASAALDIALTHRGEHGGKPIPMCGVPVAAAEAYLARLIRRGFRVAVCEQMEAPAKARAAKVPIRREVVRLVTPGTLTDEALLEPSRPNLLLGLARQGEVVGAAWLDVSTGLFETEAVPVAGLAALLGRLDPAEILAPDDVGLGEFAGRRAPDASLPTARSARERLAEAFLVASLEALGSFSDVEAQAAMLAVDYVRTTQAGKLPRLSAPVPQGQAGHLAMDAATRASLEILRARDGGSNFTLFAAVQRTTTAAGARLLAQCLSAPLTDAAAIAARQDGWAWLLATPQGAAGLRTALRGAPDMARALGRLSVGRWGPRDLAAIRDGLGVASQAAARLAGGVPALLGQARGRLTVAPELLALLSRALADPPPVRLDDGGAITPGFDGELDAHRRLRDDSRQTIAAMQLDFAQRFGVASLKIRHHAQLGYVLEAPAVAVEKLRGEASLTLRQGMANGARFTHSDLSDLDRRITEAADAAARRERSILDHLAGLIRGEESSLADCAQALALLDVLCACARLAEGGSWCRPEVSETNEFAITGGRHPVVDANLPPGTAFVPNDCTLPPDRRILLLTGPNMAGKSTFLRQNALAVILAQAGLPVPATGARIGIVDRLFSRVGAADDLARGRSTFMVEMTETAAILHQAGPRSLVVVDEIGRGTATLDGLAIAWAVLEALHNQIRCRTLFATHFHELAGLSGELPMLAPHTMRVQEWKGSVVFLHEVAPGAAGRSWGVHVAQLAGVPQQVVRRAGNILAQLEKTSALTAAASLPLFAQGTPPPGPPQKAEPFESNTLTRQPDPFSDAIRHLIETLRETDPDILSPRQALEALYKLRGLLPVADPTETLP
jgi:DNA mismatch repair protein MutS